MVRRNIISLIACFENSSTKPTCMVLSASWNPTSWLLEPRVGTETIHFATWKSDQDLIVLKIFKISPKRSFSMSLQYRCCEIRVVHYFQFSRNGRYYLSHKRKHSKRSMCHHNTGRTRFKRPTFCLSDA